MYVHNAETQMYIDLYYTKPVHTHTHAQTHIHKHAHRHTRCTYGAAICCGQVDSIVTYVREMSINAVEDLTPDNFATKVYESTDAWSEGLHVCQPRTHRRHCHTTNTTAPLQPPSRRPTPLSARRFVLYNAGSWCPPCVKAKPMFRKFSGKIHPDAKYALDVSVPACSGAMSHHRLQSSLLQA